MIVWLKYAVACAPFFSQLFSLLLDLMFHHEIAVLFIFFLSFLLCLFYFWQKVRENNWTSLHYACLNGYIEIVKLLIQDERVDVNKQSNDGCTPFYVACHCGRTEVVKYMMQDKRVDVNKPNNNNMTPIWVASNWNRTQVVQAILQSGRYIDLDAKYQKQNSTRTSKRKRSSGNSQSNRKLHSNKEKYTCSTPRHNISENHHQTCPPLPSPSPFSISSSTVENFMKNPAESAW